MMKGMTSATFHTSLIAFIRGRQLPPIPQLLLVCFLIWWGACSLIPYNIVSASVTDLESARAKPKIVRMPHFSGSPYPFLRVPKGVNPEYIYQVKVRGGKYQRAFFQIVADDCVTELLVNRQVVNLKAIRSGHVCDTRNGFYINLGAYMWHDMNEIRVRVTNKAGGGYGLAVNPVLLPFSATIHKIVTVFLAIACAWSWLLLRLRFRIPLLVLSLLSLLAGIMVFYNTSYRYHGPDWWGHLPYIHYVNRNWSVPRPSAGWQFYQQPLYYFIAAAWGRAGQWLELGFISTARHFSILCVLVFILYGLMTIRRAIRTPWVMYLCSAALLFWPLFPALYGRMTNEILVYPIWAASSYYLLCWYQQRRIHDLALSIGIAGIMMIVKTTGLVMLGMIALVVLYEIRQNNLLWRSLLHRALIPAVVIVVLCSGYNFGRTLYYKIHGMPEMSFIIGNMHVHYARQHEYSSNDIYKFITFSIPKLLNEPFLSYADDRTGRLLFWNSYLKSSLYGFDAWPYPRLAIRVTLCLALMVAFTAVAAYITRHSGAYRFFVISILVAVLAQMVNRMINMTVGTQDARMTLPVIIAFITLAGLVVEQLVKQRRYVLAVSGAGFISAFVAFAAYYVLRTVHEM